VARGIKKTEFIKPDDVVDDKSITVERAEWAGFTSDYFLTAVISDGGNGFTYVIRHEREEAETKKSKKKMVGWARIPAQPKDLEQGVVCRVKLFMGPKDRKILEKVGTIFPNPSTTAGSVFRQAPDRLPVVLTKVAPGHNYGLSIILATVILRLACSRSRARARNP